MGQITPPQTIWGWEEGWSPLSPWAMLTIPGKWRTSKHAFVSNHGALQVKTLTLRGKLWGVCLSQCLSVSVQTYMSFHLLQLFFKWKLTSEGKRCAISHLLKAENSTHCDLLRTSLPFDVCSPLSFSLAYTESSNLSWNSMETRTAFASLVTWPSSHLSVALMDTLTALWWARGKNNSN